MMHMIASSSTAQRAEARSAVHRLAAVAFGHPVPEFQQALEDGRFHAAFNDAWFQVTGRAWPQPPSSPDFVTLEAGYIDAFMHGRAGKPRVPLLGGEYDALLAGQNRPAFMLNVRAFYAHFGLQAATADEGRPEEPDHLSDMLEFMAVLCHLEARALARGADAAGYRRAQRDFLHRYLAPLLEAIQASVAAESNLNLDPTLLRLIQDLPAWCRSQAVELEAQVGTYDGQPATASQRARSLDQNLWS